MANDPWRKAKPPPSERRKLWPLSSLRPHLRSTLREYLQTDRGLLQLLDATRTWGDFVALVAKVQADPNAFRRRNRLEFIWRLLVNPSEDITVRNLERLPAVIAGLTEVLYVSLPNEAYTEIKRWTNQNLTVRTVRRLCERLEDAARRWRGDATLAQLLDDLRRALPTEQELCALDELVPRMRAVRQRLHTLHTQRRRAAQQPEDGAEDDAETGAAQQPADGAAQQPADSAETGAAQQPADGAAQQPADGVEDAAAMSEREPAERQDHQIGTDAVTPDSAHSNPNAATHGGDGNSGECDHAAETAANQDRKGGTQPSSNAAPSSRADHERAGRRNATAAPHAVDDRTRAGRHEASKPDAERSGASSADDESSAHGMASRAEHDAADAKRNPAGTPTGGAREASERSSGSEPSLAPGADPDAAGTSSADGDPNPSASENPATDHRKDVDEAGGVSPLSTHQTSAAAAVAHITENPQLDQLLNDLRRQVHRRLAYRTADWQSYQAMPMLRPDGRYDLHTKLERDLERLLLQGETLVRQQTLLVKAFKRFFELLLDVKPNSTRPSPRIEPARLVRELVTKRTNLSLARRTECEPHPILLALDISGSCETFSRFAAAIANALKKRPEYKDRIVIAAHVNGGNMVVDARDRSPAANVARTVIQIHRTDERDALWSDLKRHFPLIVNVGDSDAAGYMMDALENGQVIVHITYEPFDTDDHESWEFYQTAQQRPNFIPVRFDLEDADAFRLEATGASAWETNLARALEQVPVTHVLRALSYGAAWRAKPNRRGTAP